VKRWRPRRSRRAQRWALAIVLFSLACAAWAAHGAYQRLAGYPDRSGGGPSSPISFEIARGTSFPRVLRQLVEHGVLTPDDAVYFKLFVLHKGAAGRITAGKHTFRGDMTPIEMLEELTRRPPARETRITIPEGANMLDVARIVEDAGLGSADAFLAAMRDREFVASLGIEGDTIEGFMFPDTYRLPAQAMPDQLLTRLVERHRSVYALIHRRHRHAADKLATQLGWNEHEVVTLASIVEKETAAKHERPLIAGVFLNRLRKPSFQPKYLATDPTIIYGCTALVTKSSACRSFDGRIRRVHLRDRENPYNTYTHEGLPPGPICNPGRAALEAVFAPERSRYLYFVSRNDGTHQFSKTEAEHERHVDIYQRGRRPVGGASDGPR
jgi:UPF0755 protein